MAYSLNNNGQNYNISASDAFISLATGLSGIPYSMRHWELSNKCDPEFKLGHRVIAALVAIPLIGGLFALIERVIAYICDKYFKPAGAQPANSQMFPQVSAYLDSHQINTDVNRNQFNKYLFSHPQVIDPIKILLANTVCLSKTSAHNVVYHQVSLPQKDLNTIFNSPSIGGESNKISFTSNWFDYSSPHHFYIDFAHATAFGGAYRSYGCVQEERMFAEFPDLAILEYKTQNGIHACVDSDRSGGHTQYPPHAKANPFIIESIKREFDISKTPYGHAFQKADYAAIKTGIFPVKNPVPVNIIGIAAVCWGKDSREKYQIEDLTYHLEAAYLGNKGAKELAAKRNLSETVVHTAPWGCGAFKNSEKMMTAIQYLAARMAGVDLVFEGIVKPGNSNYTQENVEQVISWISKLIKENKTPKQIMEILVQKNLTDPTWAPKKR